MDERQIGRLLLDEHEELSIQVLMRVWERLEGYQPPRIARDELLAAVRANIRSVLGRLAGEPIEDDNLDEPRARELGTSRALQGLQLADMVMSFRVAERLLMDAFLERAESLEPTAVQRGLHTMAETFDRLSGWVVEAYRETQQELTSHFDRAASDLVSALVSGDISTDVLVKQATALGLDPDGTYQALALVTGPGEDISRRAARLHREVLGVVAEGVRGRILSAATRGAQLFVLPTELDTRRMDALVKVLRRHPGLAPAMAAAPAEPSLLTAGRSCRRALAALSVAPAGTVIRYDDVLLPVMVDQAEDVAQRLRERFGGLLEDAPHLRATVEAYYGANMSIRDAAVALQMHPNSVAYRLDRLHDQTGLDPRQPRDLLALALAGMAVRAARRRDGQDA